MSGDQKKLLKPLSLLLAMISFLESFEVFQRTTLAFEPKESSVIVVAFDAWRGFLFAVARTCHCKPEKLVSCQAIGAQQQVFVAFLFPFQVVVISEIKLVKCFLKA